MLSLSAKGAKSESDVAAGSNKPSPGRYLMVINAVDETFEKKDSIIVDFKVLAGNVPDQRDKVIQEYFATSEKAMSRLTRLALCTGLLQPDEEKDVSFMSAVSRVLFVEVEPHSYEKDGKKIETVRVSFGGMWSVGNPDIADLHKVPEIAAVITQLRGGQPPAGSAPSPTPSPTQPGDKGKWGALL